MGKYLGLCRFGVVESYLIGFCVEVVCSCDYKTVRGILRCAHHGGIVG